MEADWMDTARVLEVLGLAHLKIRSLGSQKAVQALMARLVEVERQPIRRTGCLYENIERVAKMISLTDVDQEVLAFTALLHRCSILKECLELLGDQSADSICELLALALGIERTVLEPALRDSSPLCSAGLLRIDYAETDVPSMLNLLDGLDRSLFDESAEGNNLFFPYFRLTELPQHSLDEFPHLQEDIKFLHRLLTYARNGRTRGINILLYGETGTGKTEFVRALAKSLNTSLFEVAHESVDTDLRQQQFRFRAYQLAQEVLARKHNGLILFDEIEDVFSDHALSVLGQGLSSGRYKAWTNAVLESNRLPTIWISNNIDSMDPAYRRRFSYALEFRSPPRSIRRQLLIKELGKRAVSSWWIERASAEASLTPAIIKEIGQIARLAPKTELGAAERFISRTIEQKLRLMGHSANFRTSRQSPALPYSLKFLNASQDLEEFANGLEQRPICRACLEGPPGTGKTAFVEYLAKKLDKPLIEKKASDLLSCWVGGTERNLAAMFQEASEEDAILFLDEVDSLLQERSGAHHLWETTQVNQLLTEMEQFEGVLVCATNRMDNLDEAVLRRFEVKIKFGYLKADQAWSLFTEGFTILYECDLDYDNPSSIIRRLEQLSTLTPGDFAAVHRQARVLGKSLDGESLLTALEKECRVKQRGTTSVEGFPLN
jgi:SpoVK/Ycf46/Vps4 family AAA+-type ATPase